MSLRTTIAAVVTTLALAPASAHAATNGTVLGVATGQATVNTATLELSAEQKVLMSHIGAGTVTWSAQASRTDGIVRAIGPFTITASGGDKVTGVGTLRRRRPHAERPPGRLDHDHHRRHRAFRGDASGHARHGASGHADHAVHSSAAVRAPRERGARLHQLLIRAASSVRLRTPSLK